MAIRFEQASGGMGTISSFLGGLWMQQIPPAILLSEQQKSLLENTPQNAILTVFTYMYYNSMKAT